MSVLLEALKKAAEDKNKSIQSDHLEDSGSNEETQVDAGLVLKTLDSSDIPKDAPKIDLDENVGKNVDLEDQATDLQTSERQALPKLVLSSEDEAETVTKPLSIDDLDLQEEAQPFVSGEASELSEPMIISSVEPVSDKEQVNQSERALVDGNNKKEPSVSDNKSELDESYNWSLDNLPGYQSTEVDKTPDAPEPSPNKILTTNKRFIKTLKLMSVRQFIFGRSSNIAIYSLFSILVLSTVGFFSVYYFQQQTDALDQNMRKYNLVRTVLPTELESKTPVRNSPLDDQTAEALEDPALLTTSIQSTSSEKQPSEEAVAEVDVRDETQLPMVKTDSSKVKPLAKELQKKELPKSTTTNTSVADINKDGFVITRSSNTSNMQDAYSALYQNDLVLANQLFSEIIEAQPTNITGLNGYASVQASLGNNDIALDTYQKVLTLDSSNLHAFEAMVSLLGNRLDASEWVTEIKRILTVHPESSVLNYALGNLFARENDWKKAQSYYFDAYALENTNADYLVNLAVSLDHLGQYDLAEKYYTLALVHSGSQSISFNEEPIKQRVISIRQLIGSNN